MTAGHGFELLLVLLLALLVAGVVRALVRRLLERREREMVPDSDPEGCLALQRTCAENAHKLRALLAVRDGRAGEAAGTERGGPAWDPLGWAALTEWPEPIAGENFAQMRARLLALKNHQEQALQALRQGSGSSDSSTGAGPA